MTFTGHPPTSTGSRRHLLRHHRAGRPPPVRHPPGGRPRRRAEWIAESARPLYHAALGHGANHLVTLTNEAMDRLRDAGVTHPERVLGPLLRAALENTLRHGDAALTGRWPGATPARSPRHVATLRARRRTACRPTSRWPGAPRPGHRVRAAAASPTPSRCWACSPRLGLRPADGDGAPRRLRVIVTVKRDELATARRG
jgi:hypothetical protein